MGSLAGKWLERLGLDQSLVVTRVFTIFVYRTIFLQNEDIKIDNIFFSYLHLFSYGTALNC